MRDLDPDLSYRPLAVGPVEATLTISASSAGGPQTVSLAGPGLAVHDPAFADALGVPPGPVRNARAEAGFDEFTLSWSNPRDIDFADAVVRIAQGTTPPATPTDGADLPVDRAESVQVTDLDPGTTYSFARSLRPRR